MSDSAVNFCLRADIPNFNITHAYVGFKKMDVERFNLKQLNGEEVKNSIMLQ